MARIRTPLRAGTHTHGHHPPRSNTQRFWAEYAASRTENRVFPAQQTERFWSDYTLQPRPLQLTSARPPTRQHTTETKSRSCSLVGYLTKAKHLVKYASSRPLWAAASLWQLTRRPSKLGKFTIGGAFLLYLHFNYQWATTKAAIPSPAFQKYDVFPTWMHADPVQVLGLPAAVSPDLVPNMDEVHHAWRQFQKLWRSRHYEDRGFDNQAEAESAFLRGRHAYTAMLEYTESPWCDANRHALELLQRPGATYSDNLPQFASPCRCTYPEYVRRQLRHAFVPYSFQEPPPQNATDLGHFCPCTKAMADASWKSFVAASQPPPLKRIYDSLSWDTLDWRVVQYKIYAKWNASWLRRIPPTAWDLCVEGKYEGCEQASGWIFPQDFIDVVGQSYCHDWSRYWNVDPTWGIRDQKADERLHGKGSRVVFVIPLHGAQNQTE